MRTKLKQKESIIFLVQKLQSLSNSLNILKTVIYIVINIYGNF